MFSKNLSRYSAGHGLILGVELIFADFNMFGCSFRCTVKLMQTNKFCISFVVKLIIMTIFVQNLSNVNVHILCVA